LLYLVYINDVVDRVANTLIKFADETKSFGVLAIKKISKSFKMIERICVDGPRTGLCCLGWINAKLCIMDTITER
jgi:hypothetical protein